MPESLLSVIMQLYMLLDSSIVNGTLRLAAITSKSVFEKPIIVRGHRLTRVAHAAMTMRVSATAVSCS